VGARDPLDRSRQVLLDQGEALRLRLPGGGGFGDPLARDPALVAGDVRRGVVTPDRAREDYGVVIGGGAALVDVDATTELRAASRDTRERGAE
jgi:N-methylhydantoinase B